MIVEKNTAISMADGAVLRANVYRPEAPGRYPVVMSFGVYGKDIHFEDAYNAQWNTLNRIYPGLATDGSSGHYLRWEMPDPERWVPDGFVIIAIDARGTGQSPGYLDLYSPRETQDYYECIEWAGVQGWSNGRVGLLGVSYLAFKQWQVAALRPPHLAAIVPWEGACDHYRDATRHGGIWNSAFRLAWWPRQVLVNQNGNADTTHRDRDTGEPTTGTPIAPELLAGNRADTPSDLARHVLDDQWFRDRSPQVEQIEVPVLSAANWGGPGNHLRGNVEGFCRAGSAHKWLFGHIGTHYESFYLPHYVAIQKRFLNRYLRDEANGWDDEPRVQIAIRDVDGGASLHTDSQWPLTGTRWTDLHLDAATATLSQTLPSAGASLAFEALGEGIDFALAPFERETVIAGPLVLRTWVSSSTADLDLFVVLRAFRPDGSEVIFTGAHEKVRVAMGWQRASHRKLCAQRSLPWRPWHTHDGRQMLTPGEPVAVDVEILPTTLRYPAGSRLVLTVRGRDLEVTSPARLLHNDPTDRDPALFAGTTTLHTGGAHDSWLRVPVIGAA